MTWQSNKELVHKNNYFGTNEIAVYITLKFKYIFWQCVLYMHYLDMKYLFWRSTITMHTRYKVKVCCSQAQHMTLTGQYVCWA